MLEAVVALIALLALLWYFGGELDLLSNLLKRELKNLDRESKIKTIKAYSNKEVIVDEETVSKLKQLDALEI